MNNKSWLIIGSSAAILTMFGFLPQIVKIIRTKSARDVSPATLLQFSLGTCLWIAYGLHLEDKIIITANSVTLSSLIFLSVFYFKYGRRK